jgi:hypothetical protein
VATSSPQGEVTRQLGEAATDTGGPPPDLSDLVALARVLIAAAEQAGATARAIGGVAVVMHAENELAPALRRTPEDIDLVVAKSGKAKLDTIFSGLGFSSDRRFNALHGAERKIYYSPAGIKVDVFVGEFRMCHVIPIEEQRLVLDHPTAPLAELLITKAQVVQLTSKDATDLMAIIGGHELGDDDDGVINLAWIAELCARDWGLWRTVSETLRRLPELTQAVDVDEHVRDRVSKRVEQALAALERAPKSQKWKMRNRIGDRVAWYELPEDPTRTQTGGPARDRAPG